MEDLTIKQFMEMVMEQARVKGFGTKPEDINVGEKIALIHTEISEAYEGYRHNNFDGEDGVKEGLGDAVQRIFHLCGVLGIDIEEAILKKLESNKTREWEWKKINEKRA